MNQNGTIYRARFPIHFPALEVRNSASFFDFQLLCYKMNEKGDDYMPWILQPKKDRSALCEKTVVFTCNSDIFDEFTKAALSRSEKPSVLFRRMVDEYISRNENSSQHAGKRRIPKSSFSGSGKRTSFRLSADTAQRFADCRRQQGHSISYLMTSGMKEYIQNQQA